MRVLPGGAAEQDGPGSQQLTPGQKLQATVLDLRGGGRALVRLGAYGILTARTRLPVARGEVLELIVDKIADGRVHLRPQNEASRSGSPGSLSLIADLSTASLIEPIIEALVQRGLPLKPGYIRYLLALVRSHPEHGDRLRDMGALSFADSRWIEAANGLVMFVPWQNDPNRGLLLRWTMGRNTAEGGSGAALEVEIDLDLPQTGRVRGRILWRDGQIRIHLAAGESSVREQLRQDQRRLFRALEAREAELTSFSVGPIEIAESEHDATSLSEQPLHRDRYL